MRDPLIAMGGLGEAAEVAALQMGYGGLLMMILAAAIGLFAQSRVAVGISIVLAVFTGLLFIPQIFLPSEPIAIDDPDIEHWAVKWRQFAFWWCMALAIAIVAAICVGVCRHDRTRHQGDQGGAHRREH